MVQTLRASFASIITGWRMAFFQLLLLPALAVAFGAWLWVPEAHWWQLLITIVGALLISLALAWLQAATIRCYRDAIAFPSQRTGVGPVVATLIWLIIAFVLLHLLPSSDSDLPNRVAGYLQSKLSATMRQQATYEEMLTVFRLTLDTLFWYVVPALMFPLGVEWATRGIRRAHYRNWGRTLGQFRYWLWLAPAAVIAALIPRILEAPTRTAGQAQSTVEHEIASLMLRFVLFFVVMLACWLFSLAIAARITKEVDEPGPSLQPEVTGQSAPQPA